MRFTINVNQYSVLVLDSVSSVNQQLTTLAAEERDISLRAIRNVLAFRQIVQIDVATNDYSDLLAAVRFDTKKGNTLARREFRSLGLKPSLLFKADDVADLGPYRRGTGMCGQWKFEAYITFYRPSLLRELDEDSLFSKIATLPNYTQIGALRFTVVQESEFDLLPTGEFRRPRELRPQDTEVVVDVNDI